MLPYTSQTTAPLSLVSSPLMRSKFENPQSKDLSQNLPLRFRVIEARFGESSCHRLEVISELLLPVKCGGHRMYIETIICGSKANYVTHNTVPYIQN